MSEAAALEMRKRRRERVTIVGLSVLFLLLTWAEYALFDTSKELPFYHSIFFFGLVNFNIVILLLLMFLIFRNVVKGFVERREHWFGKSLKSKLIAAFVSFSVVPTFLMFLVSVVYINNSFDKWFNVKTTEVLKNSLEVTNAFYLSAKKRNYHFAAQIVELMPKAKRLEDLESQLERLSKLFRLDAVEFYPEMMGERIVVTSEDQSLNEIPKVSLDFLRKGIEQRTESSTIHHFEEGNLVRVIVPVAWQGQHSALVVSSFIPMSLISQMDDIASAYEDLRHLDPIEHPLKSIYLIILIMMTLVIVLCATWFGVHLARQLSIPLEKLGEATEKVAHREYDKVEVTSGSFEINQLIENFNTMVNQVNDYNTYIEVILANVSTGVVAIDQNRVIRTINRHAGELLEIDPKNFIGRRIDDVLNASYLNQLDETLSSMKKHSAVILQKELQVSVRDRQLPMQVSVSLLRDDKGKDLGEVVVFEDLSMLMNVQRAAAWKEVASRIAHEIKNPLTPIKLSAQRLQKKFADVITDPAFTDCTNMIIREADELKNMVNEFNQFARLPQNKPVVSSLHQVLNDVIVLYQTAHKQITFNMQFVADMPNFAFDPEQMKRALINLLDNSVAAVAEQPKPEIGISTHFDSLLKIVRLEVVDNGPGIPKNMLKRVFEPYITMKDGGTGLGLAIVKRIIEDHRGFVRALSNKPQGTRIVIELPVSDTKSYDLIVKSEGESHVTS
jgi:two-component system, NtrC family, nitrogen regulation sensor histidine kinase NtrY